MSRLQGLLIGALLIALCGIGLGIYQSSRPTLETHSAINVGDTAPAYSADTLDGQTVQLAQFIGEQAVLVNLWATWCGPCRKEIPALQKLHEQYGQQGLKVIGVSIDGKGEAGQVRRYTEQAGVTYTILYDPGDRFTSAFQTIGVPETFLIDKDGKLTYRWRGEFDPYSQQALSIIRRAIHRSDQS